MDRGRTEAFSDGVFAVAITLLVLSINLPENRDSVASGLLRIWPSYLAYVVSFLSIGIMWINHHALFRHVVRVDRPLLMLNLLLLMVIVLVPFPTGLLGQQFAHQMRGNSAQTVVVAYGAVMILMAMAFSAVWWYVMRHPAIRDPRLPPAAVRVATWRFSLGGLGYPVATVIGLWEPVVALALFGVLSVYYLFEHLPMPADD